MSELDKLVENYFAPRSKTFTKHMLYEIFDEALDALPAEEDYLGNVLDFLRNNGYEDAKEKGRTSNRLVITNMGGKDSRNEARKKLQQEFN